MPENYYYKGGQPAFITNILERIQMSYSISFFNQVLIKEGNEYNESPLTDNEQATLSKTKPEFLKKINAVTESSRVIFNLGFIKQITPMGTLSNTPVEGMPLIPLKYFDGANCIALLGHNMAQRLVKEVAIKVTSVQYLLPDATSFITKETKFIADSDDDLTNLTKDNDKFLPIEDGYSIIKGRLEEDSFNHDAAYDPVTQTYKFNEESYSQPYFTSLRIIYRDDSDTTAGLAGQHMMSNIIFGSFYEAPSPNLEYSISYENDRYTKIRGLSGIDFVQPKSSKRSFNFSQGVPDKNFFADKMLELDGRKNYSMTFSTIANKDMFPAQVVSDSMPELASRQYPNAAYKTSSESSSGDYEGSYQVDDVSQSGNTTESLKRNFYTEIISNTSNTMLPFIFINNVNAKYADTGIFANNIMDDQFDVCMFSNNSIDIEHVAHNLWSVSLDFYSIY
tara:strand:- start:122 stop:1471 length:1350 start_codon:yes stop_codon:yes gene_type:complete